MMSIERRREKTEEWELLAHDITMILIMTF
jgi:hypothetical protein